MEEIDAAAQKPLQFKKLNEISMSMGTVIISVRSTEESLDKVRDTTFEILGKVQGKSSAEHNYWNNAKFLKTQTGLFTKKDLTPKDPKKPAELKRTLHAVTELHATLEKILDQSLTDRYIDANPYVREYNRYRNELFALLPDEDIGDILTELQTYVYIGDELTDVRSAKQLLVEVYLKTSQLMAYLENLLELG